MGTVPLFRLSKRGLSPFLFFIAVVFAVYGNCLRNGFVYDDHETVEQNLFIRDWRNLPKIVIPARLQQEPTYFTLSKELTYRPLVTLSYFLDYALYRDKPFGYHLTSVLLHLANACLLFYLFSLLFGKGQALVVSLLFAVFPTNAEAVNAISYREDLLVALFGFLSFIFFFRYRKKGTGSRKMPVPSVVIPADSKPESPVSENGRCPYLFFSLFCYFLAMLSKENGVVFPLLFAGYEKFISEEDNRSCQVYNWYLLPLVIFLFLRFGVFRNPQHITVPYPGGNFFTALTSVPMVFLKYLKLVLVPWPLLAEYPSVTPVLFPGISFWLGLMVVFLAGLALHFCFRKARTVFFGLLWFLVFFLPVSNLVPLYNQFAERYLYLPAIGFFLGAAYLLSGRKRLWFVLAGVLVLFYVGLTIRRNVDWRSDENLWLHNYRWYPQSVRTLGNLGAYYYTGGKPEKALFFFKEAGRYSEQSEPSVRAMISYNIGRIYWEKGEPEKALIFFRQSLALDPQSYENYFFLGNYSFQKGDYRQALNYYEKSLQAVPVIPEAYLNIGVIYLRLNKEDQAARFFQEYVRFEPGNAEVNAFLSEHSFRRGTQKNLTK